MLHSLPVDIDECGRSPSVCSEHATCSNFPGSFVCSCNSGFSGNGFICEGKSFTEQNLSQYNNVMPSDPSGSSLSQTYHFKSCISCVIYEN